MKKILLIIPFIFFVGCSTTPTTNTAEVTPTKKSRRSPAQDTSEVKLPVPTDAEMRTEINQLLELLSSSGNSRRPVTYESENDENKCRLRFRKRENGVGTTWPDHFKIEFDTNEKIKKNKKKKIKVAHPSIEVPEDIKEMKVPGKQKNKLVKVMTAQIGLGINGLDAVIIVHRPNKEVGRLILNGIDTKERTIRGVTFSGGGDAPTYCENMKQK